ncbi:hypothetical protein LIER_36811 [Lithospermum erythrorhizon]|uniref:VQ domain-containing protein n=1 Tax=Lithospermum erythrorhizon TaxID=34254 RepID=A0AAV3PFP2_LITER
MENLLKHQENQNPSFLASPKSFNTNVLHHQLQPPTPPTISPISRSDPNNPYPTTFVQAHTSSFKQIVQMLTGSSSPKQETSRNSTPPVRTIPKIQKPGSKLYERRNLMKNFKLTPIGSGHPTGSTRPEILSPSVLDFPSLVLSPVTPLIPDPFNRSTSNFVDVEAEEKAIAQKRFYLHPSPNSTPTDSKPRLLPLFPETSPRLAGSSNCDA